MQYHRYLVIPSFLVTFIRVNWKVKILSYVAVMSFRISLSCAFVERVCNSIYHPPSLHHYWPHSPTLVSYYYALRNLLDDIVACNGTTKIRGAILCM